MAKKKTEPQFPTLYTKNSNGTINRWDIFVELSGFAPIVVTRWGQVDGAIQEGREVITEGKNIGKKNETTPFEQAAKEAKAKWTKQKKLGYVESLADAEKGKVDEIIEGGIFPMLAQKYRDHAAKIKWPAFVQPKLDGIRCIAIIKNGKCSLWTRTRKRINSVPHIVTFLENYFEGKSIILDGELYNHDLKSDFEKIVSAVRKDEPAPGNEIVQYHVYDIIDIGTFQYRATQLLRLPAGGTVQYVPTHKVESEEKALEYYSICMEDGYEGIMIRNSDAIYEVNKRSYNLQKVKEFDDDEFEIVGTEEGKGTMAGKAVFICKTKKGDTFNAKMKGKLENLRQYLNNPKVIGKKLTVRYQGYTKYNIPRFPVGITVRDYE